MCGICGVYHLDRSRPADQGLLRRMMDSIAHRGPDDEGIFTDSNLALGHKRLSIIDLTPSGHQPMTIDDGRYWIVFNGEIYNYLELRQQLAGQGHEFHSHSDTEVILHLYQQEGEACVQHLNGMFAFAIWDRQERTLFIARDHFGIKPFYYFFHQNTFAFASEIKALLATRLLPVEMNHEGLADYLTFQFCLGEKTLFRNIVKLPPGHSMLVKPDGTLQIHKYWDLNFHVDTDHTREYFRHSLLSLLEDSVRLQLRADVPVGAHLSGGLDSSTVACLASSLLDGPIHTFSGGFRDGERYDETAYARLVAEKAHTVHHEIYPSIEDFPETLPRLVYFMDEPAAGPGIFPQYFVSKLAKEKVKVVMGGQGGDEIFGGYTRYLIGYLEECIRGGIAGTQEDQKYVVTFESILPNLTQLQGYQPLLQDFWQDGLFETPERRYFRLVDRSREIQSLVLPDTLEPGGSYRPFDAYLDIFTSGDTHSYINRMTHFDLKTLLPALLQVEDRTSMAVSLESRVPLLDYRIANLVASMPPKVKYEGGRSKHIFREVVQHIVPKEILERKDKMGFPVPLNEWYRREPVRSFVRDVLLGAQSRQRGIFRSASLENLLDSERAYGRGIWGLLCLELWMRVFIDGQI